MSLHIQHANAASYRIEATGSLVGKMPSDLGIGFGFANENGNSFTWLRYLGTSMARVFIQPFINSGDPSRNTANWRNFASNSWSSQRLKTYGDQYGRAFDNSEVVSEPFWRSAVSGMRQNSNDSGKEFFTWLVEQLPVRWATLLSQLETTNSGAFLRQKGNPEYIITNLKQHGYTILALFDFRCDNLPFLSSDPNSGDYWKERWEEYRLMYIGARWMAKFGVTIVQLYNEPDKENDKCMDPTKWSDHMRIRSQAIQDGYADFSEFSSTNGGGFTIVPQIWSPTTAAAWSAEYAPATMSTMNLPFPGSTVNTSWKAADGYSFHRYGSFSKNPTCTVFGPRCWPAVGYNIRRSYDVVRRKLAETGTWRSLPVGISEFNCFTGAAADNSSMEYFRGKHVMDYPSSATCLAAQVAGFATTNDPPAFISVHKFVQNLGSNAGASRSKSCTGKNGLFYGDTSNLPHIVTGSTMSGEAYRLIATKTQYSKSTYGFISKGTLTINGGSRLSIFAVDDSTSYYVYVINESASLNDVKINFAPLIPQPNPWSFVVASGTGINPTLPASTLHGEVAFQKLLGESLELRFSHPPATMFRFSVPKVPTLRLEAEPSGDATLWGTSGTGENFSTLQVTSADAIAVTVLKFDISGRTGDIGIVNAVLQLHLESCSNAEPQVVTVLGLKDANWDENTVQWSSISALKPNPGPLLTTTDNFINWWVNPPPAVAGYITVPPSSSLPANGTNLALDLTEMVVKDGITSFLLVKMRRYDQSLGLPPSQLPAELVSSTYTFASKEALVPEYRPKLVLAYQVTENFPPPVSPPPPPVPPPPSPPLSPPPPPPRRPPPLRRPPPPRKRPPPPNRIPPPPRRRPPPPRRRPPPPRRRPPPPRRRPPPPRRRPPPPRRRPPPPRRRPPPPKRRPPPPRIIVKRPPPPNPIRRRKPPPPPSLSVE
ncbi:hypothetical protein Ndes2437B_g07136 [Nannochloris sp. 'desiccata']